MNATQNADFDQLLKLERDVDTNKKLAVMGSDWQTRARGEDNWKRTKAQLSQAFDALTLDQLRAFGEYRKVRR
jgi:hypothetical protein